MVTRRRRRYTAVPTVQFSSQRSSVWPSSRPRRRATRDEPVLPVRAAAPDGDGRVDIEKFFGYIRRVATTGAAPLLNRDAHSSSEIAAATALSAMYRRVRGMLADGRTEEAIHDLFTLDNTALDIHTLQVGARRLGQELSREQREQVARAAPGHAHHRRRRCAAAHNSRSWDGPSTPPADT